MISIYEQFLTKRQRTIQMNQLRGRQFRISPMTKQFQKNIKQNTEFRNPLKDKIMQMKYKMKKGLQQ